MSEDNILIVDDVPANVRVLYEFLTQTGFKVRVAKDGYGALKTVEHARPDLILLDVMMPGIDGFEVCRCLKEKEDTRDIPVIFMTALADTLDKVKGFSLGAVDYITKPIQHEEVLARVSTHLSLRKLQKQLESEICVRKSMEDSLQQHAKELEKRNLELDAFARTVAHDLKNPLNGVIGFAEILLEECEEGTIVRKDIIEHIQWVMKAGVKMRNIVDALLLLAGVSKNVHFETAALDMGHIISQVIEHRLTQLFNYYRPQVILPEVWLVAQGYAPWVEEIWANYLSNALKYGGNPPKIELGASQEENQVRFWVRDNGQGLALEAQQQLFTPFTRLHKERAEGHGLGLSIVQQVAEKLGGSVGVESEEGKGSLFYFTLPN